MARVSEDMVTVARYWPGGRPGGGACSQACAHPSTEGRRTSRSADAMAVSPPYQFTLTVLPGSACV